MKFRSLLVLPLLLITACSAMPNSTKNDTDASSSASMILQDVTLRWEFSLQSEATDVKPPRVTASLAVEGGETLDLGTYNGTSFTVPGNVTDLADAPILSSASTWFAGGGDDLLIMRDESGDVVVLHRTVDEEVGVGELVELARLHVAPTATVTISQ